MSRGLVALVVAVLLSGCSAPASSPRVGSPSPAATPPPVATPSAVARQVLPPSRWLPAVALCSQDLTLNQDGTAAPVLCANGSLNVKAWRFFAPLTPRVLSAGPAASLAAVQSALRRDCKVGHATASQVRRAYDLAAAYYGWTFDTDPTGSLDPSCV